MLEASAFLLFAVANLHYQLSWQYLISLCDVQTGNLLSVL